MYGFGRRCRSRRGRSGGPAGEGLRRRRLGESGRTPWSGVLAGVKVGEVGRVLVGRSCGDGAG